MTLPPPDTALQHLLDRPLTPDDLAAGASAAAAPPEARATARTGVLLFQLAGRTFAIHAKSLQRITTHAEPTPIPHRDQDLLRGLCNIRGELILCADLRRLLGLPLEKAAPARSSSDTDDRRMVVIGPADAPWVFEADALLGIERIDTAALRPLPPSDPTPFAIGITQLDERELTLLDAPRILEALQAGLP